MLGHSSSCGREIEGYLDLIDQGICIFAPDFTLKACNRPFRELLDYPEELCSPGTPLIEFLRIDCERGLHGDQTPEEVFEGFRSEVLSAPSAVFETRLHNGQVIEFARRRAPDGAVVCTFTNITGMRRAAEALERDSAIIRHLSDAVAVTDLERRIVYHNPAFSRLFGLTPRDALHRRLPPEGFERAAMTEEEFARRLGEQIAERGKHTFQLELGPVGEREELVVEGVIVPRRDTSGDHVGYIAVYRDVTEQTRISRRLLRQDRIIAQLSEAVVIADTDCIATDCNEAAERLFGYSRAELIGQHIPTLLYGEPTPGYPRGEDILASLKALHRWSGEMLLKTKNGGARLFDCNVQPFFDEQGRHIGYIGVHRDVTERRAAEDALRRQALVMEHLSEAVVVTDAKGVPEEFNACAERLLGLSYLGEEPAAIRERLALIARTVQREGRYEGLYSFVDERGEEIHMDAVGVALTTRPGAPPSIVSVHRDITERVRQEREQKALQEQMERWKRLETLGRLAGGMAHDFNNVLTPIIGYAHLVLHQLDPDSRAAEDMKRVIDGMETARDMVRNILTFGQRVELKRRPISFDRTIDNAVDILTGMLPDNIRVQRSLDCPGATIFGNSTQLHQIVMNLCTNAVQAMPEGGEIRILTDRGGDWEARRREYDLPEGAHVRLVVEDDGCGIPAKDIEHIFEPFYTTKPKGKGTGLGLSVVHGIVRSHGGAITVHSEPGVGTRFEIYLPLAREGALGMAEDEAGTPARAVPSATRRGRHILVVDDESDVREMLTRLLAEQGCTTQTAPHGRTALEIMERRLPDLLITDRTMPEMDGEALTRAVHRRWPQLPVILMSGMIDAQMIRHHREWGAATILAKPILPSELQRAIADAFESVARQERHRHAG